MPFFALVAVPLVARHATSWVLAQPWGKWFARAEKYERGAQAALHVALIIALVALNAVMLGRVISRQPEKERELFPAEAVAYMRANRLPDPVFNRYDWGGYLIWRLYPDYRVYIDGRADVYGDAFLEEYVKTVSGQYGWKAPFDRFGIRTVIIGAKGPLASLLREDKSWKNVFEDSRAIVFVKE
jgi:hypothetical protein